ncbi:hypothetical protein HPB48_000919 [Haemaphysalis longicornis]|uniref:Phospholipid scramblase n=1 Tax=Haemaphysalis longicornis TaxID=44386 RepID=A0A9J6F967_HAELO|nr:hypothetical protein HPB48_000919 [Haemaphysalis longicornis]
MTLFLKYSAKGGGMKLGYISKNWRGMFEELFTDADNFTLVFPIDLDVKVKALLLGAAILIVSTAFMIVSL